MQPIGYGTGGEPKQVAVLVGQNSPSGQKKVLKPAIGFDPAKLYDSFCVSLFHPKITQRAFEKVLLGVQAHCKIFTYWVHVDLQ